MSPAELEARIAALSRNAAETEAEAIAAYRDALQAAQEASELSAQAADYERQITAAPADLERLSGLTSELAADELPPSRLEGLETLPLDELQTRFAALKIRLATARSETEAKVNEQRARADRSVVLPDLITKASADLAALAKPSAPVASAPERERAEYQQAAALRDLLQQRVQNLQSELAHYEATAGLFAAQTATSSQRFAALSASVDAWQKLIDRRRLKETGEAVQRARENVEKYAGHPVAGAIARETLELAERHGGEAGLSRRMANASERLARLTALKELVAKRHAAAKRRVKLLEDASLRIDPTTGQLLRRQRQDLDDRSVLREQTRDLLSEYAQAQIDAMELADRRAAVMAEVPPGEAASQEVGELRTARDLQLATLIDDNRTYVNMLSRTTSTLRDLMKETELFARFVDERLLWIPSAPPLGLSEPRLEADALRALFADHPFGAIAGEILHHPIPWTLAATAILILAIGRRRFLVRLSEAGAAGRRRNCTSFVPTLKALAYTALLAAPLPLFFGLLAAGLHAAPDAILTGLRNTAGFVTFTILFLTIAHPQGLMVDHFRMQESRVRLLRANLLWFIPVMAPLIFLASALAHAATNPSAGRLLLILTLVVLMVMLIRLLRPSKHLIHWRGKAPNRLAPVCFALGIAAPLALIAGAATGYYASVQELRGQALLSVWMILLVLFVAGLLYRWILVSRRRLAVQRALARRAAALAENQSETSPQHVASPDEVRAEATKVVEVEEQTSRLVRAAAITTVAFGLWGVWSPAVPALSALDRVTLWSEADPAPVPAADSVSEKDSGGGPLGLNQSPTSSGADSQGGRSGRVTLQDLAASFITLLLTSVAALNIPGLLELTIFRRLRLKPGSSFAFTTTIRYIIVVTGIVIAFGLINITWAKVQWIAAAITLGIGFGLQEIFANFVAGLIILFERPIRLGDVVTVGDVSGRVTQIRIRATTIRQFNNRELIVPNKEFITGKLVNWTLSDSILRVEIPVGIAYGSDTAKAREIMLRVANENPRVLSEPAADVLFDTFADSSLAFQLRANVGSVEDLILARSELHYAIDDAFRRAGIEIAFPQTDIHIRSAPGLYPGPPAGEAAKAG